MGSKDCNRFLVCYTLGATSVFANTAAGHVNKTERTDMVLSLLWWKQREGWGGKAGVNPDSGIVVGAQGGVRAATTTYWLMHSP